MALVRVYCGLASADLATSTPGSEMWLTVAVVDDAGRLLDLCDISDDAVGYAELGALLAERSSGPVGVAVAADGDDHVVTQLLVAAGRYLAYADGSSADDFAERFADDESAEEIRSSAAVRRAIGLARALQAGVLSAVPQAAPRDLLGLKPVLSAHAAVISGRQSAASTLREVLRELYPAALRAYPDPSSAVPLAVIEALPEPNQLNSGANGRSREASVVSELAASGVAEQSVIAEAVTALRVAVAETPRRTGTNRSVNGAIAETIRQAVAAVRACDGAAAALVSVLAERIGTVGVPAPQPALPTRGRPTPPPLRAVQNPPEPTRIESTRSGRSEQTRPEPTRQRAGQGGAVPAAPAARVEQRPPSITQIPTRRPTTSPVQPPYRGGTPGDLDRYAPGVPSYANSTTPTPSPDIAHPGSRADWPLRGEPIDDAPPRPASTPSGYAGEPFADRPGRVKPPWQSDDLPAEPPSLRLVENETGRPGGRGYGESGAYDSPPLRLVESDRDRGPTALDRPMAPVSSDDDRDLLIFAATRSAWFTKVEESDVDAGLEWSATQFDQGWQAAEQLSKPAVGTETSSGLPRRVPKQNLVPGSAAAEAAQPERPLRIVRDAAAIAANTSGYFRGWQRGQEVGGYAVGGRPGRESAGGWDFSRDPESDQDYEYRSASNR